MSTKANHDRHPGEGRGLRQANSERPVTVVVDTYGTEHLMIDTGEPMLESVIALKGFDPDGTPWVMPYWLPRDAAGVRA